jgi:hypothetical protein
MRADVATPKVVRTKPPKGTSFAGSSPPAPPTIAAPAGHTAKTAKAKSSKSSAMLPAIECTSPAGKATWTKETPPALDDDEHFTPKTVRWLSATPPIYAVDGMHRSGGINTKMTMHFRACEPTAIEGFELIGDGMWASTADDKTITIFQDHQPVAILSGSSPRTAR